MEVGWLSITEAAKYCSIGQSKMREIFRRSDFPVRWIGNKQVVARLDLDKYIREGKAS